MSTRKPTKSQPFTAWSRAPRPGRGPSQPLSREQIVHAAVALMDAEGLDALSLRKLGAKLGAGATSLYWHIANKEELLDLVLDEVIGEVPLDEPTGDWRADLRTLAARLREVLLQHPYAVVLMNTRQSIGPNALRRAESMFQILSSAGFADADLFNAYSVLVTYVAGEVAQEVSFALAPTEIAGEEALTAAQEYISTLDPATYPILLSIAPLLAAHDQQAQFGYGLDVILDGLARRTSATS